MIRQKVTITNPTGLHLRPAGMFCNIASRYKCKVEFMYDDDVAANAKSVLSVLGACVKSGDEIELICDGEDWTACVFTQAVLVLPCNAYFINEQGERSNNER